jgi:hypothetical protein
MHCDTHDEVNDFHKHASNWHTEFDSCLLQCTFQGKHWAGCFHYLYAAFSDLHPLCSSAGRSFDGIVDVDSRIDFTKRTSKFLLDLFTSSTIA